MFDEREVQLIANSEFYAPLGPLLEGLEEEHKRMLAKVDSKDLPSEKFPKKCSKCGIVYQTADDFMNMTNGVGSHKNDICYNVGGKTKIFRYRNCPAPCHSTLVVVTEERRDSTIAGIERRKVFGKIYRTVLEHVEGIQESSAHNIALYLIRGILHEGLSASESYVLMMSDISEGRFKGFQGENPIVVDGYQKVGG